MAHVGVESSGCRASIGSLAALTFLIGTGVLAQEGAASRPTIQSELARLDREYDEATRRFAAEYRAGVAKQGDEQLPAIKGHPAEVFIPKWQAMADAWRGNVAEIDALTRVAAASAWLENAAVESMNRAIDRLLETALNSVELPSFCDFIRVQVARLGEDRVLEVLKTIRKKTALDDVRAAATYHLACQQMEFKNLGDDDRDRVRGLLLELKLRHAGTIWGRSVEPYLFELDHLQVGMLAPDFDAIDMDGRPFRLAESRGKVVVLCFWGLWSEPCRALLPTLNAMSSGALKSDVHVVGVNSDGPADLARAPLKAAEVTWRQAVDVSPSGPLASRWNVFAFPMVYVLDRNGIIKHRHLRGKRLEEAVAALIKS